MNLSAAVTGLVPQGPVTLTSTVPAGNGGAIAAMSLSEITLNALAGVLPNFTEVAPVKCWPEIG